MELLKGAVVSARIKQDVLDMIADMEGYVPTVAIVRVGDKPDDISYERSVIKKMAAFGMNAETFTYPKSISEEELLAHFEEINASSKIDGILLLLPLPKHINKALFELAIDPVKDLDGISPINRAKIFAGEPDGIPPCTAESVMEILHGFDIPVAGKHVVVVGRSMVVGRPFSMLALKDNATVTICHSKTENLREVCRSADILVAAVGRAEMLDKSYVKDGAVVVDVGIHVREDGSLCGDVNSEGLAEVASAATPVPGGVGAVTTALLCKHLAEAAQTRRLWNIASFNRYFE